MTKKIDKNFIIWLVGALAIGIASNAIWEFLARPLLSYSQNTILTFVSLGIDNYKDSTYIDIARGHYDRVNSLTLVMVLLLLIVIVLHQRLVWRYIPSIALLENRTQENCSAISGATVDQPSPSESGEEAPLAPIQETAAKVPGPPSSLFFATVIVFVCVSMTVTLKIRYATRAVAYFDQLMTITAPYINESKSKALASDFAQIKNKSDYERIISTLRSVAKENNLRTPYFDIW